MSGHNSPSSLIKHHGKKSQSRSHDNLIQWAQNKAAHLDKAKEEALPGAADMKNVMSKMDARGLPPVASVSTRLWMKSTSSGDGSFHDGVSPSDNKDVDSIDWAIAMHGGAGEIKHKESINDRLTAFEAILKEGMKLLEAGGTAVDVAEKVTVLLEDCPWFNAGKGSVFTNSGTHEMDAAIMDGSSKNAGACACVSNIKNPIKLARTVMEKTSHILIVGPSAEQLGFAHGIERADPHYFFVQERYDQLVEARLKGVVLLDHGGQLSAPSQNYASNSQPHKEADNIGVDNKYTMSSSDGVKGVPTHVSKSNKAGIKLVRSPSIDNKPPPRSSLSGSGSKDVPQFSTEEVRSWALEEKYSTVGCVVKDKYGNVAAAGSTGGLVNKQPGRLGDTAIIGAGVYASENAAIACTGHGETFIRHSVAHQIETRMRYLNENIEESLASVMWQVLPPLSGGAVAVDRYGRLAASYNTFGMFTGLADSTGHFECWDRADKAYNAEDVHIPDDPLEAHEIEFLAQGSGILGDSSTHLDQLADHFETRLPGSPLTTPPIPLVEPPRLVILEHKHSDASDQMAALSVDEKGKDREI